MPLAKSAEEGATSSQDPKQEVAKKLLPQLDSVTAKLKAEQQRSRATSYKLQQKEQELAATLESLESKELELRQMKAESEGQKEGLESAIEDLEGEVQRLQETQADADARCTELSSKIQALQTEIEQLQAEKVELESRVGHSGDTDMSGVSEHGEGATRETRAPSAPQHVNTGNNSRQEFLEMQQRNFDLQKQIQQVKADHASIAATLQGLSVTVQGVLNLPSREAIAATLQGVLGMIQGVLNLGARPSAQNLEIKRETKREGVKREDVKRERVKDEDDDNHDLYTSHSKASKRRKQAESIDLTEDL